MKLENKLRCEDWVLYDNIYEGCISTDSMTGIEFGDVKEVAKEIRVFGTKNQLKEIENKYNIDEAYTFDVEHKLQEYKKLYELNDNKILIFRIR
tara:strand:+ start:508 stop:789 length:282 start_codon:yes stop_codon:yes gene_type:complete